MMPTRTNNGNRHGEVPSSFATLLDAAIDNDSAARRRLFDYLATLDAFEIEAKRTDICAALNINASTFRAMLRAAQAELRAAAPRGSGFVVDNGGFAETAHANGRTVTTTLTNFVAWIDREIVVDDGETQTRRFVVRGELADGTLLPAAVVDADKFQAMKWIASAWGARAIISPGPLAADKVRAAIQRANDQLCFDLVYSHTGWAEIGGEHVYLSAGGGIGPRGRVNVTVDLPAGLELYALPDPPDGEALVQAVRASCSFLEIAPLSVTAPLLATVFLAPLLPFLPVGFTTWLYGPTGTRKTALAVEALRHFGGGFAWDRVPASWGDTENRLEERSYYVSDCVLLVDDFAPQGTGHEAAVYAARAGRFVRAVGNRAGRGRLNSDLSPRRTFRPRGLVMATGELLPPGSESNLARLLVVELRSGDVDLSRLSHSQQEAGALYAASVAGFVRWVAQRWDMLVDDLPRRFMERRGAVGADPGIAHGRTADVFQAGALALATVSDFATDAGALTREEAEGQLTRWLNALAATARAQREYVQIEKPTARFFDLLRTLLQTERVRLECVGGAKVLGGVLGEIVGWYDSDYAYLLPGAAYHAVTRFAREADHRFTLSQDALARLLDQEGALVRTPGDRHMTVKRKSPMAGVERVWQIPLDRLVGDGAAVVDGGG